MRILRMDSHGLEARGTKTPLLFPPTGVGGIILCRVRTPCSTMNRLSGFPPGTENLTYMLQGGDSLQHDE